MDIKGTENKLKDVDSLLTTLTNVIKKHWLILLIILAAAGGYTYWEITNDEAIDGAATEQVPPTDEASPSDGSTENSAAETPSDAPADNSNDQPADNPDNAEGN